MNFRVRSGAGTATVRVAADATIGALLEALSAALGVPVTDPSAGTPSHTVFLIAVRHGFPPQALSAPLDAAVAQHLRNQDTLTVAAAAPPAAAAPVALERVAVPDDNSCLFHALSCVVPGAGAARVLRDRVAAAVRGGAGADVLERPADEYAAWIAGTGWGGELEVVILAGALGVQVGVLDCVHDALRTIGDATRRVYIIYNGVHYDAVRSAAGVSVFDPSDAPAEAAARALCHKAHVAGDYINDSTYTLRCDDCGTRA